eukprot:TRINITY_DN17722_c0_g1_i1.p1 TRINITY_DN17722_c0_g1~~TRINITY_DN17722_c0_g1_i1.p1  ORF type:complete len:1194 (+),score=140.93 TRINITY_DN17722_c0_g1_i1:194-3775(+)
MMVDDTALNPPCSSLAKPPAIQDASSIVRRLDSRDAEARLWALDLLFRLEPFSVTPHVAAIARQLDDRDVYVRSWGLQYRNLRLRALEVLCKVEPGALGPHVGAVVRQLVDDDAAVRAQARVLTKRLEPGSLRPHLDSIVKWLDSDDPAIPLQALEILVRIEPEALCEHVGAVVRILERGEGTLAWTALTVLSKVRPALLLPHVSVIVQRLTDRKSHVRARAREVLCKLEPSALSPHVGSIVAWIRDHDAYVRLRGLGVLCKLEPSVVVQHVGEIMPTLKDSRADVRWWTLELLAKLEPAALAQHAKDIVDRLGDEDPPVRVWGLEYRSVRLRAMEVLCQMEPSAIADHLNAFLSHLDDEDEDVRARAREIVEALEANALSQTALAIAPFLDDKASGGDGRIWDLVRFSLMDPKASPGEMSNGESEAGGSENIVDEEQTSAALSDHKKSARGCATDGGTGGNSGGRAGISCNADSTGAGSGQEDTDSTIARSAEKSLLAAFTPATIGRDEGGSNIGQRRVSVCVKGLMPKRGSITVARAVIDGWQALPAASLTPHAGTIAGLLDSEQLHVRWSCLRLIDRFEPLGLHVVAQYRLGRLGNTPLHWAAQHGHLRVCRKLVESGSLARLRNRSSQTPADIAAQHGHTEVAEFLADVGSFTTIRGGVGDAWASVREMGSLDCRRVVKVEWYTMPLPGFVSLIGGAHSLLAVTVECRGEQPHIYALEKTNQRDSDECTNGVLLSHWLDVAPHVEATPLHTLERDDIENNTGKPDFIVHSLRALAVELGEYNVARSNCHHMALAVFNACAKETARAPQIPNQLLTLGAWILSTFGVDIVTSESESAKSNSFDLNVACQSHASGLYEAGRFAVDASDADGDHRFASISVRLSHWIYEPLLDSVDLPPGVNVREDAVFTSESGNLVQWAVGTTERDIYVVFRGTDGLIDVVIDIGVITHDFAEHGLRVHGNMWNALHQKKFPVIDMVINLVRSLMTQRPNLENVILCGHSLGGGYAILAGLEMLHRRAPIAGVVTFGAPQVVVPNRALMVWRQLNAITTLYVNAYDIVPRLPSCLNWAFDVLPKSGAFSASLGPLRVGLAERIFEDRMVHQRCIMEDYDIVGTLLFVTMGCRTAKKVRSSADGSHRAALSEAPASPGMFVIECHDIAKYRLVVAAVTEKPSRRATFDDTLSEKAVENSHEY